MDDSRFPLSVLALGALLCALGAWMSVGERHGWWLVFGQIGLVYVVVVVAAAYTERIRNGISARAVVLVTLLPGVATTLVLFAMGGPLYEHFPHYLIIGPMPAWILAAFGLPWLYVLGCSRHRQRRSLIAKFLGLLVTIPSLYVTISPPTLVVSESGFTFLLAFGFWASILPYELGTSTAVIRHGSTGATWPVAALGTYVCGILFRALVQTDQLYLSSSYHPGRRLRDLILFGPFGYLGARGALVVLRRRTGAGLFEWLWRG